VVDFMPVQDPSRGKKTHQIVRVVRAVRGAVRFRLECQPAFDYARRPHQVTLEGRVAVFEAPGMHFSLVSRFPLARQGTGVATEFLLHPGEPSTFILRQVEGDGDSGLMEARLVGTASTAPTSRNGSDMRFVGLHPDDQRGCDRSLQPGEDGRDCSGAGTEAGCLSCRIGR
jgi:hypothetical protein